jgi:hypothetical protein
MPGEEESLLHRFVGLAQAFVTEAPEGAVAPSYNSESALTGKESLNWSRRSLFFDVRGAWQLEFRK